MSLLANYLTPQALVELKAEKMKRRVSRANAPANWRERLTALFPDHVYRDFSPPHVALWEWAAAIGKDAPRPFVAIWPRGRGKSTHSELIAADLGARGVRRYCLYVSETQEQADKHVSTIQRMLEAETVARYYPQVGTPRLSKNGGRQWRRGIMTTANGYTVEAVGLDRAVRGQKIDWARPDLIILDDIDAKHDTAAAVERKTGTLTASVLPSGADNAAVLFAQNLIHEGSIAHKLSQPFGVDGAADFLADRLVSGPYPAVDGLAYEARPEDDGMIRWVITAGTSLWAGYDLDVCEDELNRTGPGAFELESQHAIDTENPNALLTRAILDMTRVSSHPDFVELVIGVDPSGGTGQTGIVAVGKARAGRSAEYHGYTVGDFSTPAGTSPREWAVAVLRAYHALRADRIVVERNFGGDMARDTIRNAKLMTGELVALDGANVRITEVVASRGKVVRAQPVAALFEQGRAHHVGHFPELEKQWTRWGPGDTSPDRLDAEVWAYTDILDGGATAGSTSYRR